MDYLSNDYLVPIVLGEGGVASSVASYIREKTAIRPYILSHRHSLGQKLIFKCKKLMSSSEPCVVASLCDLAAKLESTGSLLLVYTKEYEEIIKSHSDEIESRYVAVSAHDLINNQKEF